jgi:hypothetical protein
MAGILTGSTKTSAAEPVLTSALVPVSTAPVKAAAATTKESLKHMLDAIENQESRSELQRSLEQESRVTAVPSNSRIEDFKSKRIEDRCLRVRIHH